MKGFILALATVLIQVSWISAADCDVRFYQHYAQKGCSPVLGDDGCPTRFQCDPVSDELRLKCLHNGKLYRQGESVPERCESCTCRGDQLRGAQIECAEVDCPDWEAQNKACYMGYKSDACCPTEMCPSDNEEPQTCSYQGKTYKIGQIIQTSELCSTCICTKDWTGPGGPGCRKVNCLTGIYAQQIRQGCLPVYSHKTCCATGIHCGDIKGATPVSDPSQNTEELCHYREKFYEKGSTVYPTTDSGIECSCVVPPDFTCIRKRY